MVTPLAGVMLGGCAGGEGKPDAYGNFEAKEVIVSSEAAGKLLWWTVEEGQLLEQGQALGTTDTIQLWLKRKQLVAQRILAESKLKGVNASVDVQKQQQLNVENEKQRVQRLLNDGAATTKQMDDLVNNLSVIEKQITSTKTQYSLVSAELLAIDAQLAQVGDQLRKSRVECPRKGTVLESYVEQGELVATGKALCKLADLDNLYLRAYITGKQLGSIAIGKEVKVLVDNDKNGVDTLRGIVAWVSKQAEFTPKTVQTREERVNFVYAFKVKVNNASGRLKIGMPGEVLFD